MSRYEAMRRRVTDVLAEFNVTVSEDTVSAIATLMASEPTIQEARRMAREAFDAKAQRDEAVRKLSTALDTVTSIFDLEQEWPEAEVRSLEDDPDGAWVEQMIKDVSALPPIRERDPLDNLRTDLGAALQAAGITTDQAKAVIATMSEVVDKRREQPEKPMLLMVKSSGHPEVFEIDNLPETGAPKSATPLCAEQVSDLLRGEGMGKEATAAKIITRLSEPALEQEQFKKKWSALRIRIHRHNAGR